MRTDQLIVWGSIAGVFLFCILTLRLLIKTSRQEFSGPEFEADEPSVPEQFWGDRCVTRVKSNGEEKEI